MSSELVFKGVNFFLVNDNDLLKQILKIGGAQREFYISDLVTYVIADTCDFPQYKQVVECKIPIVTTTWIHSSVMCGTVLPPKPFSPINDNLFSGLLFCPTQIPWKDRDALLSMMLYYGGKFQTNLSPSCTHLVAGKAAGKKYEFIVAKQPQIKIVTAEWIVDSIKANEILNEADYAPCPPKTALVGDETKESLKSNKEIPPTLLNGFKLVFSGFKDKLKLSLMESWKETVRKAGAVVLDVYCDTLTHVICLHQQAPYFKMAINDGKKVATAYWLNEVLSKKKVFAPDTPLHLPTPFTEVISGINNYLITLSGYVGEERLHVKHMITMLGAQYTGDMTRGHTHLICKKPSGEKYKKALEWGIMVVSPKWLGDMWQTGQCFPCKMKTKYSALGLPDELKINTTFSMYITDLWNEQLTRVFLDDNCRLGGMGKRMQSVDNDDFQPACKVRKLDGGEPIKRVLFTGLTGATVHRLRQSVMKMGGELARGVNDCTHLVAPKITRTVKFLSAVSICKFLVAPAWVDDSFEVKGFLDEQAYTLVDPESEELFGFKLKRSLQRAQTRQVCRGLHFHVTPAILPAPNAMREIIECAGGKMSEISTPEDVFNVFLNNSQNDLTHNSYLVSCMDDKNLWSDLVSDGYDVYNVELILSGVMKQELEWSLYLLRKLNFRVLNVATDCSGCVFEFPQEIGS